MRGIRCAVAAVLAAGIVTVVAAQPGRQPGGLGGGGFGGLDLNTLVLSNTALQEELKVTDAQKEKFKPAAEKQAEQAKKFRDVFGGGKGGFDKEKFAELQEEGKKVAEEVKKVVDETLTTAQKKRIQQINVQMLGVNAFIERNTEEGKGKGGGRFGGFQTEAQKATIKEVNETLKLSDAQKTKIKEITEEHNKDLRAIRTDIFGERKGGGGFGKQDPEKTKDFQSKSAKLVEETMGKIAAELDEAQKKAWKGLTGEAFDTSKLFQPRRKD